MRANMSCTPKMSPCRSAGLAMSSSGPISPWTPRPGSPPTRLARQRHASSTSSADALNIINYLARQEHPDALYIWSKWLEFGKFGHRVDKREAFSGYKRAAELAHARSEYRMGMLFEQSNDMSKAKEHYYRGMSMKDSAALYRIGMMSLLGQHGETKDYARGLERIHAAADSADEDAPQGSYVYGMLAGRELPDISMPDGLSRYSLETAKMYIEKAAYLGFRQSPAQDGPGVRAVPARLQLLPVLFAPLLRAGGQTRSPRGGARRQPLVSLRLRGRLQERRARLRVCAGGGGGQAPDGRICHGLLIRDWHPRQQEHP